METVLPVKTDFPDWLSPMLVKELRQGVRTRVFVSLFILLQVLMLMDVSLTLLVAASGGDTSTGTVFFWIMVGLPVLIVLPFNGMNAVGGEMKANTLELIFLTRLTAFRIIAGKWFAIFAQTLLLVCAVLPYLVLRYFIGGVNVSTEMVTLASMLGGSALLAAFATGISAYPTRLVRPLAGLLGFFLLVFGLQFLEMTFRGMGVLSGRPGGAEITGLILCGVLVLVLMLEVGAAKIAPPAENHSAVMRLLALGAFVLALAAGLLMHRPVAIITVAFVIAFFVCTIAVCEEPRWIQSLFRPFAARGFAGRMAGRLMYPGWHTGVLFTLVVFAAFGTLLGHEKAFDPPGRVVLFVAAVGTLLMPVALIRWFFPKTNRAIALFLAVQCLCAIATIFCLICDSALKTHFKELVSFLPLSTLIFAVSDSGADTAGRMAAASFTTLASLVPLLAAIRRPMGRVRLVERECLPPLEPTTDEPLV